MNRLSLALLAGMSIFGLTLPLPIAGFPAVRTFQKENSSIVSTRPVQAKVRQPSKKLPAKSKAAIIKIKGNASHIKSHYGHIINSACKRYTVDPDLVLAMIKAESDFNTAAMSPKGAMGLMQLMPITAQEMGVSNPLDPVQNIHGGVGYLRRLLNRMNGDLSLALAAYNAGPEHVKNYKGIPPFRETWVYIGRVMNYYLLYKGKNY